MEQQQDGDLLKYLAEFICAVPSAFLSRIVSAFERTPELQFSFVDARKGGQFGSKLKRLQPYCHRLSIGKTPVYRQAFLWGVMNYLDALPHEELVIGFGVAEGTRTKISEVMKVRGDEKTVSLGFHQRAVVDQYLKESDGHCVLFIHNHPKELLVLFLLGLVFGNHPMPSITDHKFAIDLFQRMAKSKAEGFAFGKCRFYLLQNGITNEFSGITSATLLAAALALLRS